MRCAQKKAVTLKVLRAWKRGSRHGMRFYASCLTPSTDASQVSRGCRWPRGYTGGAVRVIFGEKEWKLLAAPRQ